MNYLSLITAVAFSVSASAAGWKHHLLTSSNGTAIALDYQTEEENVAPAGASPVMRTSARPLWLNVHNSAFGEQTRVRVVVTTFGITELGHRNQEGTQTVDLAYASDHRFTGALDSIPISQTDYSTYVDFTQEIAIVVDGDWLKDPINGSSNFQVTLSP